MSARVYMLKPDVTNFRIAAGAERNDVRLLMRARTSVRIADAWTAPHVEWIAETTGRPRADLVSCGGGVDLLSRRAAMLLRDFITSNGEYLDVLGLEGDYIGFHVVSQSRALDLERSAISINQASRRVSAIWEAAFDSDALEGFDIFRVETNSTCYFVSDSFVHRVTQNGLTGFRFAKAQVL